MGRGDSRRERVELPHGAWADILREDDEARIVLSHAYRRFGDGRELDVYNDTRVAADYVRGALHGTVVLSMHVVLPARLGRVFLAGADVSPGAKTYLEFLYEHDGSAIRLAEIRLGARRRWRVGAGEDGAVVRPAGFPFPVPDRIEREDSAYPFPFLDDGDVVRTMRLPIRLPPPGRAGISAEAG